MCNIKSTSMVFQKEKHLGFSEIENFGGYDRSYGGDAISRAVWTMIFNERHCFFYGMEALVMKRIMFQVSKLPYSILWLGRLRFETNDNWIIRVVLEN